MPNKLRPRECPDQLVWDNSRPKLPRLDHHESHKDHMGRPCRPEEQILGLQPTRDLGHPAQAKNPTNRQNPNLKNRGPSIHQRLHRRPRHQPIAPDPKPRSKREAIKLQPRLPRPDQFPCINKFHLGFPLNNPNLQRNRLFP